MQQCTDAIKRAQILKEKMGLPKSVATPAAQTQQSSGQLQPLSNTAQEAGHEPGALERQGSLPNQQPASSRLISKAISMPSGSSNLLRAYAAGAIQMENPVEEGPSSHSPQCSVLGMKA